MPRKSNSAPGGLVAPVISRDDMEAALWRTLGQVGRGSDQRNAVRHLLTVAEQWALSCGASELALARGAPAISVPRLSPAPKIKVSSPRTAIKGMRTHMLAEGILGYAVCGKDSSQLGAASGFTEERDLVTCGNCLMVLVRADRDAEEFRIRQQDEVKRESREKAGYRLRADDGAFIPADGNGERTCKGCKRRMPLTNFTPDISARAGRKPRCRECVRTRGDRQ